MSNRKIRILHVILFVDIGGLEKLVFEMGSFFINQGYEVEVLCLRSINSEYINNINEKIPVYLMRKSGRLDFSYHYRVAKFIRDKSFDVIHAHSGCFWDASLFKLFSGVKRYIYTAHGLPLENGIKAQCENLIAGILADRIVAVSTEIEEVLRKSLFLSRSKISTIINGINTDLFVPLHGDTEKQRLFKKYQLPSGHFLIGSVGRLAPEKNYAMLLYAFSELIKKIEKTVSLLLVGDGPMKNELQRLAIKLSIEKNVIFMGIQHNVHEILPLFDVFVLPSFTEGTSISLLEAQSCGVPAVVTDVGGNGFVIIHGENGLLCSVDDIDAMAKHIEEILTDNQFATYCALTARKRVKKLFSLKAMAHKYEQFYRG